MAAAAPPRPLRGRPQQAAEAGLAGDNDENDDDDDDGEVSNAQTRRRHRRADERFQLLQARVDELVAQGERHAELLENHAKMMLDIAEGFSRMAEQVAKMRGASTPEALLLRRQLSPPARLGRGAW
eukprot:CAMPEP_0170247502 /NCGR_PEP_ID=MMETSP0116_2-20130129/23540_1 /TAXON_ID=400756 /ORGANISM="Durinskia baltica, Strain CSIRO CS-38" /LENGTH=125 /DNA_ID=CAMNT_0010498383 /DNA_START=94 /DNA_END=469 /DNA_ORIENTATION=-